MYKLLKNTIIKGDYQFPPDLYTLADITKCAVLNNYLYFRGALWILNFKPFRTVILHKIHNSLITGHPGSKNTFALLARDFYWPYYLQNYRRFIRNCKIYAHSQAWRK